MRCFLVVSLRMRVALNLGGRTNVNAMHDDRAAVQKNHTVATRGVHGKGAVGIMHIQHTLMTSALEHRPGNAICAATDCQMDMAADQMRTLVWLERVQQFVAIFQSDEVHADYARLEGWMMGKDQGGFVICTGQRVAQKVHLVTAQSPGMLTIGIWWTIQRIQRYDPMMR